ncbi:hypothetical protein M413DRAFT_375545 [Hebeloma cylindrosporum]|uniref:Uncharacterized protein n=1 Tax=Hebeloma cylindrosporum TaxID=76867 RepID=A0A0C3CK71_HEBCY|nr:hypothetical protein M413DRAFT_375545 [Hebeloma cylindrosporum h7]
MYQDISHPITPHITGNTRFRIPLCNVLLSFHFSFFFSAPPIYTPRYVSYPDNLSHYLFKHLYSELPAPSPPPTYQLKTFSYNGWIPFDTALEVVRHPFFVAYFT